MPHEVFTADQLKELQDLVEKFDSVSSGLAPNFMKWTTLGLTEFFLADQCLSLILDNYPLLKGGVHMAAGIVAIALVVLPPLAFVLDGLERNMTVKDITSGRNTNFMEIKTRLEEMVARAEILKRNSVPVTVDYSGHTTNTMMSYFSYGAMGAEAYVASALAFEGVEFAYTVNKPRALWW